MKTSKYNETKVKIGNRIRELREKKRMNQIALALKLGVSQARISRIEQGHAELEPDLIIKLSELFRVSCDYIFTGKEYSVSGFYIKPEEDDLLRTLIRRYLSNYKTSE